MVTNAPRSFAYIRASKTKQHLSAEAQRATIREFLDCRQKIDALLGRETLPPIAEEFVDAVQGAGAASGNISLAKRKEGARLLETVRSGDHVIVSRLDRIGRRAVDMLLSIQQLEERGVAFHFLNFGGAMEIDTSTPAGRLFLTQLAGFAEFERAMIGERTKLALDANRRAGKPTCKAPYGMRIVKTYRGTHVEKRYEWDPVKLNDMLMVVELIDQRGMRQIEAREYLNELECIREGRPYVKGNFRNKWNELTIHKAYWAGKRYLAGIDPVAERAKSIPPMKHGAQT